MAGQETGFGIRCRVYLGCAFLSYSAICHGMDFKGFALGEPTSTLQIEEQLKVRCGTGSSGGSVCNGATTVAGFPAAANIVLDSAGNLQRVLLRPRAQNFEAISEELAQKLGKPSSEQQSVLQNGYGAKFQQVERVWTDTAGNQVEFRKYNGAPETSLLYYSTSQDRERLNAMTKGKKGDL